MDELNDTLVNFTLYLDGREEAVKVVEPEMDVPLPENGRLVVKADKAVWCDVRFVFNPGSDRPYELYYKVLMGNTYANEHLVALGAPLAEDKDLLNRYKMEVVDRGDVNAWLEMIQGKARLFVKHEGGFP